MNIEPNTGDMTVITLSETNIDTLAEYLKRLRAGELPWADAYMVRKTQQGMLSVVIEPDTKHYDRPEGGAGPAKDIMTWPTMEELSQALAAQNPPDPSEAPTEEQPVP